MTGIERAAETAETHRRTDHEASDPRGRKTLPTGASRIEATVGALLRSIDALRGNPNRHGMEVICLLTEYFCRRHGLSLKTVFELVERKIIMDLLRKVNGNQRTAARILGLKFSTLNMKIRKHGIRIVRRVSLMPDGPAIECAAEGAGGFERTSLHETQGIVSD